MCHPRKSCGKTNCDAHEDGTFTCKAVQPCGMPERNTNHLRAKTKAKKKKMANEKKKVREKRKQKL